MMDDPLIEEVRALRRQVVAEAGNDVATLCDQLRALEAEYTSRRGIFADVPEQPDEEPFPEMKKAVPNPIVDEVREIRAR